MTASSQRQSQTAQCTLYTHCVAKCALPVCCVISAALGQLTAMLFKNSVSIGYKLIGSISGCPNVAYTTGHVARAAGGESNSYFTKTSVTF